ncbi:MAG TPA: hypothetical protein VFL83_02540 [Anaeromyxobacter sp.]|nr:hypothetical protein [Anaeromyxobacter sp.]
MSCPMLRRAHPARCMAVAGEPTPVGRDIVAAYCHGRHGDCPAYRYVRAAGRPLHAADFRAWVVERISPGCVEPDPADRPHGADPG